MKPACCARILFKYTYLAIFNRYEVSKSSLTRAIRKIYRLFKIRNLIHLQNRVEAVEISRGKFRSTIGLTAQINKAGLPNYLDEDEGLLVVTSSEIEGGHSLPLDYFGVAH